MAEENKKLTLVERAFALPDSEKEFGMKIADHKLICNVLDDHMNSVENMVDQKILKTLQSDKLTDTIADKVYDKLAEYNKPVLEKLETLIDGLNEVKERLEKEDKKIDLEVKRLDTRIDLKRDKIEELRDDFEENKKALEEIAKHKPTLETIQKVFKFWTWKENKLKIIITIGVILFVFSVMVISIYFIMRKLNWITDNYPDKKHASIEQVMIDIKTGNVSNDVRAVHPYKLTKAESDTMIAQQERVLIKPVTITYNKR